MKIYTEELKKLNSIKLCLMAHPDNEPDSEFADRINDCENIIQALTPIELPTRDMADVASLTNSAESKIDFINGFIWTCSRIREQIN